MMLRHNKPRDARPRRAFTYNNCGCEGSCDENCLNLCRKFKCDDSICGLGIQCGNRVPSSRALPRCEVFTTTDGKRGRGLRLLEEVQANTLIREYTGKLIQERQEAGLYIIEADGVIIDGTNGSDAKYVNHSCEPNCRVEKWVVDGSLRFFLYSNKAISPSEELTIFYGNQYALIECFCGSVKCQGSIGRPGELPLTPVEDLFGPAEPDWDYGRGGQFVAPLDPEGTNSPYFD